MTFQTLIENLGWKTAGSARPKGMLLSFELKLNGFVILFIACIYFRFNTYDIKWRFCFC